MMPGSCVDKTYQIGFTSRPNKECIYMARCAAVTGGSEISEKRPHSLQNEEASFEPWPNKRSYCDQSLSVCRWLDMHVSVPESEHPHC